MKLRNVNCDNTIKWKYLENTIYEVMQLKNFRQIRLSLFQDSTILYNSLKSFEGSTDSAKVNHLVMQTNYHSKLSLRPEGTINVLNNFLGLDSTEGIKKFFYLENMYRNTLDGVSENYRLGAEIYGDDTLVSDINIIETGLSIIKAFGFQDYYVKVGSYGCKDCSAINTDNSHEDSHDDGEKDLSSNSELALLKKKIAKESSTHSLCTECSGRLNNVKHFLSNLRIDYKIDYNLKRTFDYYNSIVFNFYVKVDGEDILLGGGGRYDQLTKQVVGRDISSIGFDLDLELLYELVDKKNLFPIMSNDFKVYICSEKKEFLLNELQIHQELQDKNIYTVQGIIDFSINSALNKAISSGCSVMVYISEDSLYEGKIEVNNIQKQYNYLVALDSISTEIEIIKKSIVL